MLWYGVETGRIKEALLLKLKSMMTSMALAHDRASVGWSL